MSQSWTMRNISTFHFIYSLFCVISLVAWANRGHWRCSIWGVCRWHSTRRCRWGADWRRAHWWGSNWRSPSGWPGWRPYKTLGGRHWWNTLWVVQWLIHDISWGVTKHLKYCVHFRFSRDYIVDTSKEATFKVAPSKWEAVDESELEAQGEPLASDHQKV